MLLSQKRLTGHYKKGDLQEERCQYMCSNFTVLLMSSPVAIQKRHFLMAECNPMNRPIAWLARLSADTANHCAMQWQCLRFAVDSELYTLLRKYKQCSATKLFPKGCICVIEVNRQHWHTFSSSLTRNTNGCRILSSPYFWISVCCTIETSWMAFKPDQYLGSILPKV